MLSFVQVPGQVKNPPQPLFYFWAVLMLFLLFFFFLFLFFRQSPYSAAPTQNKKNMSALATQTKTPTDVESQTVTQAIASWGEKIANIDTQITDVRARREAADLDTSVESDAIEDECSAELRRLKKERRAIGAQVTNAMHDLSALAQNSGFVVPSLLSSPGETKMEASSEASAPTKEVSFWCFFHFFLYFAALDHLLECVLRGFSLAVVSACAV